MYIHIYNVYSGNVVPILYIQNKTIIVEHTKTTFIIIF